MIERDGTWSPVNVTLTCSDTGVNPSIVIMSGNTCKENPDINVEVVADCVIMFVFTVDI